MVHDDVWKVYHLILTVRDEWAQDGDHTGLVWSTDQRPRLRDFVCDLGKPAARQPLPVGNEILHAFYAISWLTDIAIAPYQPVGGGR